MKFSEIKKRIYEDSLRPLSGSERRKLISVPLINSAMLLRTITTMCKISCMHVV